MAITREEVGMLAMRPISPKGSARRITVLGAGGVGSNIVRMACNKASRFYIRLFDHDRVELHNLNRSSLFSIDNAMRNQTKVGALMEASNWLSGGSGGVRVVECVEVDKDTTMMPGVIIDARDTLAVEKMVPNTWIKLAYDGGSNVSFTWRPHVVADKVFDLNAHMSNTYEVVPSFYVPAAMLSLLAMRFMEFLNFAEITDRRAGTFLMDIDAMADVVSYQWEPTKDES